MVKKLKPIDKFDKTLTKKELDDFGYLQWDNDTLGSCVKAMAATLFETDVKGFKGIMTTAACYLLIDKAAGVNAGELNIEMSGVRVSAKLGFKEEEEQKKCFDTYSKKTAAKFIQGCQDIVGGGEEAE